MHIRIDSRPISSRTYLNFFFTTISRDCFSISYSKFKGAKNNLNIPWIIYNNSNVTSKIILLHCSKNIQYKSVSLLQLLKTPSLQHIDMWLQSTLKLLVNNFLLHQKALKSRVDCNVHLTMRSEPRLFKA